MPARQGLRTVHRRGRLGRRLRQAGPRPRDPGRCSPCAARSSTWPRPARDKLHQNQQLSDLVQALGCGTGSTYRDADLRYEKVVIMTDADVDGAHIASLLITFFYRQMPRLIDGGPPLSRSPAALPADAGGETVYARDDADRERLMKTVFKGSGKVEIGRFKGLGEMLPAQLKETTMDPKKRMLLKVVVEADEQAGGQRRRGAPDGQQARGPLRLHPGTRRLRRRGATWISDQGTVRAPRPAQSIPRRSRGFASSGYDSGRCAAGMTAGSHPLIRPRAGDLIRKRRFTDRDGRDEPAMTCGSQDKIFPKIFGNRRNHP